jgi:hypothetical protein
VRSSAFLYEGCYSLSGQNVWYFGVYL